MMGWGNMMHGWQYGQGYGNNYWWMGLIMMVLQLVFWAVVATFVIKMLRGRGGSFGALSGDNALELLKARYAKGEIDTEEYTKRRQELLR